MRNVLGDGSQYGLRLRYVEEPEPRGTAGALKYAEDLLDERFLMLNGDVLTDIDLTAQIAQHEATGAIGTLALVPVDDPSRLRARAPATTTTPCAGSSRSPRPTRSTRTCISAGAYVLERSVLDLIPPDRNVSIEREVWPRLVDHGPLRLPGRGATGSTSGRPSATCRAPSTSSRATCGPPSPSAWATPSCPSTTRVEAQGRIVPPALVERECTIAAGAHVGSLVVLGEGVTVGAGATIERSVVLNGAADRPARRAARLHRRPPACASARARTVAGGAVLGEGVTVGARQRPGRTACESSPGRRSRDGAITF